MPTASFLRPRARPSASCRRRKATATRWSPKPRARPTASSRSIEQYKKAPDVTRKRMFLETMERVLGDTDKVIVDEQGGYRRRALSAAVGIHQTGAAGSGRGTASHEPPALTLQPRSSSASLRSSAYLTLFTVDQTQQALVLEFGKPKRDDHRAGAALQVPVHPECRVFRQAHPRHRHRLARGDRLRSEAARRRRLRALQIVDPLLFFQSVRDERIANSRLGAILEASLRRVLGGATFADVVRDKREELMRTIATPGQPGGEPLRRQDRRRPHQARRPARGEHAGDLSAHADRAAARGGRVPRRRRGRRAAHPRLRPIARSP